MPIRRTKAARWSWQPLEMRGCHGVVARVLCSREDLVALLVRFEPGGSTCEQASDHPTEVLCLEGAGRASVREGSETSEFEISEGHGLQWTPGCLHRIWTTDSEMTALLLEHPHPRKA
jgi:quercetin dioxygenase-like cupin family protein